MNWIFTHEQADFDALAALVGAGLLDRDARPVLPQRLNRNVRAFLRLYGDRLQVVEIGELSPQAPDRVTLVDTQIWNAPKGWEKPRQVFVIDHHPAGSPLDPSWHATLETVGATTTLLVEMMQEAGSGPDPLTATLLLMGIYEDTGSLSFAGTTPRDVRAAAWLLESGADLQLAAPFLHHPLSSEQRQLYERLFESAETHDVGGLSIVLVAASAWGMVDEISTLAHKLRDLLDPAGLFVLVALDGNIQLVARSTTDALDVARVAEHFGGGGHDRAAAALIRGRTLADVRRDLLAFLPGVVRPGPNVAAIMSRDPQVLVPTATVAEAGERMRRFGHEGYPVVDEGRVVGLLTRRAVDRALAHDLGAEPVSRFMSAGTIAVMPQDSIQRLQQIMMDHDWGQVPVVDPEGGGVVGIVTRTDLLKLLAATPRQAPPNLGERLERSLPLARAALLKLAARYAEERHMALYIVGGFVRDLLLDLPSSDFDLVVEGDAIRLAEDLAHDFGGRVVSHRRFGTAKWRLERGRRELRDALGGEGEPDLPASLDLVTARTEFYTRPTALPSVERGSIKLDLHRRDFTINTLAIRLDGREHGQLLDPWGGGRDLRDKWIRVLHSLSFVEDPTRMLRAVRLEQRLNFHVEARTLELLGQALPLLARVSGERVRNELELALGEADPAPILRRLAELKLLAAVHSSLVWDGWIEAAFQRAYRFAPQAAWGIRATPSLLQLRYALWVMRRKPSEAESVGERLRLSGVDRRVLVESNRIFHGLPTWVADGLPPSALSSRLEETDESSIVAAWVGLEGDALSRKALEAYLRVWRSVRPRVDGQALRQTGLEPGPIYSRILERLREAWLDGEITSESDEASLLDRLIEEARGRG